VADLTHLDSAAITAFVDHDVATFVNDLKLIEQDGTNGYPALKTIRDGNSTGQTEGMAKPLAIGNMATDTGGHIDGVNFLKAFSGNVEALVGILDKQQVLFGDIEANLRTTIKDLLSTQGANLTTVEAEPFVEDLSDVDGDMGSSSSSSATT
jgi:hypothetical protein